MLWWCGSRDGECMILGRNVVEETDYPVVMWERMLVWMCLWQSGLNEQNEIVVGLDEGI